VNIVRTVARKSSNRVTFCWLNVTSAAYVNQTKMIVKLSTKLECQTGGQPNIWRAMAHPGPLRTATVPKAFIKVI